MQIRIANAPTSWGVEDPEDGANPPWRRLLSDVADAGYHGIELGPVGYLPEDEEVLRSELATRGLELVGGYLFEPLHTRDSIARAAEVARRTCRLVSTAGGVHLVIIQGFTPQRERAAGRPSVAQPLPDGDWRTLVEGVEEIAGIASGEYGLVPVFHPHAGTHVEFQEEIERLAADTDPELRLCIDTGHCVYAGVDPVALYQRHFERVAYLHLKDVDEQRLRSAIARGLSFDEAVAERVFCPLGEGAVDFPGLQAALERHDFHGWGTVEQDRLPTDSGTPAEHAAASLAHLRDVGLA